MFTDILAVVTVFIEEYGILAVFVLSILEEIIAPIPSSFALLAAGFFLLPASQDVWHVLLESIVWIVTPASFGITIGSLLIYSVAYLGGKPVIEKWGKWFGISWEKVSHLEARFSKGHVDELVLFGLRAFPIIPSALINAFAGAIQYPIKTFITTTFLGSVVRSLIMSLIGWSVGEAYVNYADIFSLLGDYVLWGVIAIFLCWATYSILKKHRK